MGNTYPKLNEDAYGWAIHTANLLKQGRFKDIDTENLIEELELMGQSELNEFFNRFSTIMEHLLKLQYAYDNTKGKNRNKWKITINRARRIKHISTNIEKYLKEEWQHIYEDAVDAVKLSNEEYNDIQCDLIPSQCPYSFEEVTDNDFYPSN